MIEAHQESLCSGCVFWAGGACPRFLGAAANSPDLAPEDVIINGCGGYQPRDVVVTAAPDVPAPEAPAAV